MMTTLTDVSDLARAGEALPVLEKWSRDVALEDQNKLSWANAYIESAISRAEVEWALQRSQNALRGVFASRVPAAIRDARVSYPLSFLVRGAMQHYGEVPTYEQFIEVLRKHSSYWALPMWEVGKEHGASKQVVWDACRYRAAIAWQSFCREQHALAGLRGYGIPAMSHPIADVVLKVDGWFGRHTFLVYVENEEFFERKEPSPLKDMITHHLVAPRQPGNPGVWLVPDTVIEQAIDRIEQA